MNKKLYLFDHSWQADIFMSELRQQDIASEATQKPREYNSIITGLSETPTEVYVCESDFFEAEKLLQKFLSRNNSPLRLITDDDLAHETSNKYYKRILFFSLGGAFVLPIIFNAVAYLNYLELLKRPHTIRMKYVSLSALCSGIVIALFAIYALSLL